MFYPRVREWHDSCDRKVNWLGQVLACILLMFYSILLKTTNESRHRIRLPRLRDSHHVMHVARIQAISRLMKSCTSHNENCSAKESTKNLQHVLNLRTFFADSTKEGTSMGFHEECVFSVHSESCSHYCFSERFYKAHLKSSVHPTSSCPRSSRSFQIACSIASLSVKYSCPFFTMQQFLQFSSPLITFLIPIHHVTPGKSPTHFCHSSTSMPRYNSSNITVHASFLSDNPFFQTTSLLCLRRVFVLRSSSHQVTSSSTPTNHAYG